MKIIGHTKQLKFLKKSIKNNSLFRSYLFYGPQNIGKKRVAREFAKDILSFKQANKGLIAKKIEKGVHPDLKIIFPNKKRSINIEKTREIIEYLKQSPFSAQKRIVIIENADSLTKGAANSILKFLEEPPTYVHIILTAADISLLPSTILSRCQMLRFSPPSKDKIIKALNELKIDNNKIEDILFLSGGKMDLALSLANNKDLFKKRRNLALKCRDILLKECLHEKEEILFNIQDIKTTLFLFLIMLRTIILNDSLKIINSFNLGPISKKYNQEQLVSIAKRIIKTDYFLDSYVNRKLALEYLIIGF